MPCYLDHDIVLFRSTKRRKLRDFHQMARRASPEEGAAHHPAPQDEVPTEDGCDMPADREQSSSTPCVDIQTSNREELMECIKRGQRPTWVPTPGLRALYAEEEAIHRKKSLQTERDPPISPTNATFRIEQELLFGPWNNSNDPPAQSRSDRPFSSFDDDDFTLSTGQIQSSGHALATRNFDVKGFVSDIESPVGSPSGLFFDKECESPLSTSPPSWLDKPSYAAIGQAVSGPSTLQAAVPFRSSRPRAPSLSSSFVMRVPTSPLVNATNNPNLDFTPRRDAGGRSEDDKKGRRRTMPPNSFHLSSPLSQESTPNFSRPLIYPLRRESSAPQYSHQPRRSLGSYTFQPNTGPRSPGFFSRRSSVGSEMSPKRRASMIGSFEESILRGRMSSPASKPFDFVAQIGVMGKGNCPASLQCPAHVSIAFQAVFYNYPSSQALRSVADDTPSPYVGTIDVEHNLKPVQLATKKKSSVVADIITQPDIDIDCSKSDPTAPENTSIGRALAREARLKNDQEKFAKSAPRVNLGGAYRVPEQGQLQIVIKNSNNIAVKLFLIPYDLQGMGPGTKTFVRQKSYSTGPIAEGALSDRSQRPDAFDPLKDKHLLRYLIHIKFCCPSKGKFYLYGDIRVVFANRLPDGKEKLKNEMQLPEPRFSPWKAAKGTRQSTSISSTPESSSVMSRSQSASASVPDALDDSYPLHLRGTGRILQELPHQEQAGIPFYMRNTHLRSSGHRTSISEHGRVPFLFPDLPIRSEDGSQPEQSVSPVQGFLASTSPRSSPIPWGSSSSSTMRSFSPAPVEAGNGLLSRQLRQLRDSMNNEDTEKHLDAWAVSASLSAALSSNKYEQERADSQQLGHSPLAMEQKQHQEDERMGSDPE